MKTITVSGESFDEIRIQKQNKNKETRVKCILNVYKVSGGGLSISLYRRVTLVRFEPIRDPSFSGI